MVRANAGDQASCLTTKLGMCIQATQYVCRMSPANKGGLDRLRPYLSIRLGASATVGLWHSLVACITTLRLKQVLKAAYRWGGNERKIQFCRTHVNITTTRYSKPQLAAHAVVSIMLHLRTYLGASNAGCRPARAQDKDLAKEPLDINVYQRFARSKCNSLSATGQREHQQSHV